MVSVGFRLYLDFDRTPQFRTLREDFDVTTSVYRDFRVGPNSTAPAGFIDHIAQCRPLSRIAWRYSHQIPGNLCEFSSTSGSPIWLETSVSQSSRQGPDLDKITSTHTHALSHTKKIYSKARNPSVFIRYFTTTVPISIHILARTLHFYRATLQLNLEQSTFNCFRAIRVIA